jgi:hypothetical protein
MGDAPREYRAAARWDGGEDWGVIEKRSRQFSERMGLALLFSSSLTEDINYQLKLQPASLCLFQKHD